MSKFRYSFNSKRVDSLLTLINRSFTTLRDNLQFTSGFTLAEVLITLGVIGIVAAITIPGLMNKYKNAVTVNTLKKQYAEITLALRQASEDIDLYSAGNNWQDTNVIVDALKPYIKWTESYPMDIQSSGSMCYKKGRAVTSVPGSGTYNWMTRVGISIPIYGNTASIELSNGACLGFNMKDGGFSRRTIILDINGPGVLPNIVGKDVFFFQITKDNEFKPLGYNLTYKAITSSSSSGSGCACDKTTKKCGSGMYCAARIIRDNWKINY